MKTQNQLIQSKCLEKGTIGVICYNLQSAFDGQIRSKPRYLDCCFVIWAGNSRNMLSKAKAKLLNITTPIDLLMSLLPRQHGLLFRILYLYIFYI